ncbi:MAG: ParB/RepB/Spo0J family partition protein, partial [Nitrososphaerales archaeon]|nr:ParB/RepB/Spo0J family partition protein [Nitrososphaerales archaeon]
MPAQLAAIPLKLIQPHPKLAFRFRYDVASLADSIRSAADENTPNGQLNPGRVVLRGDGEGYYVYVGVRRYFALKSLWDATKDERFAVYTAYIDTDLSELQMFVKAKKENDEENGEREGLSVLEEVSGIGRIRNSINPEELEKGLRRLFELAGRLNEKRAMKLYDIERTARFKFRIAHLERLCAIEDDREFYLAAASVAGFSFADDDIEKAVEARRGAYALNW